MSRYGRRCYGDFATFCDTTHGTQGHSGTLTSRPQPFPSAAAVAVERSITVSAFQHANPHVRRRLRAERAGLFLDRRSAGRPFANPHPIAVL